MSAFVGNFRILQEWSQRPAGLSFEEILGPSAKFRQRSTDRNTAVITTRNV